MSSVAAPSRVTPRSREHGRSRLYQLDHPQPADDEAIAKLIALTMGDRVRLSLRRGPDRHLAASIEGDRHREVIVRRAVDDSVVAYGHRTVRPLWINGRPQLVGYLGGLRVMPGVRLPRRLIAEAFESIRGERQSDEADFHLTSILSDNYVARRGLERGISGMPTYTPLGELLSVTFRVPGRSRRRAVIPSAEVVTNLHLEHDPTFQARPCFDDSALPPVLAADDFVVIADGDRPVASAAIWDQRAAKQVVVEGYDKQLNRWRWVVNACLCVGGRPMLPAAGRGLDLGYVSHIACPPGRPDLLLSLLRRASESAAARGLHLLTVGLPDTVEHRAVARRLRGWVSRSVIYAVHAGPAPEWEQRPVWPEVAVL